MDDDNISMLDNVNQDIMNTKLNIIPDTCDMDKFPIASEAFSGKRFDLDLNVFLTTGTFVVGQKGSGKTYNTSMILEHLINELNIPIIIADPLGDYKSLSQFQNVVYVDKDRIYGYLLDDEVAKDFIKKFYSEMTVSYVFDMSDLKKEEKQLLMKVLFESLERYGSGYVKQLKDKFDITFIGLLVVEEAEKFFPEQSKGKSVCKQAGVSLFYGIRHCNVGIVLIAHRIADMDKSVLSDCLMVMMKRFSSVYPEDVEVAFKVISTFERNKQKLEFFKDKLTNMQNDETILGYNDPDDGSKKLIYLVNGRKRVLKHDAETANLRRVLYERQRNQQAM